MFFVTSYLNIGFIQSHCIMWTILPIFFCSCAVIYFVHNFSGQYSLHVFSHLHVFSRLPLSVNHQRCAFSVRCAFSNLLSEVWFFKSSIYTSRTPPFYHCVHCCFILYHMFSLIWTICSIFCFTRQIMGPFSFITVYQYVSLRVYKLLI